MTFRNLLRRGCYNDLKLLSENTELNGSSLLRTLSPELHTKWSIPYRSGVFRFCCCCVVFCCGTGRNPPSFALVQMRHCHRLSYQPDPLRCIWHFNLAGFRLKPNKAGWSCICSFDVCCLSGRTKSLAQNVCWSSGCRVQSRTLEGWKPFWTNKKIKAIALTVANQWDKKIKSGPRLVPSDRITEALGSGADKCLPIGNERRRWECEWM